MSGIREQRINELLGKGRMDDESTHPGNYLKGLLDLIRNKISTGSVICEVGCFRGISSELFALHAKKLYCVDYWTPYSWEYDDDNIRQAESEFDEMMKNYDNIVKIKSKSLDASEMFKDNYLDCVYIDADHAEEFFREDMKAWIPKVKNGGIISGHDYGFVGDFIEDFCQGQPVEIFDDGSWCFIKSNPEPERSIFWIGSWADSSDKKERTLSNIRLLKKSGIDVGIITHYPDISWIDPELVDYVVYEKFNHIPDSYTNLFSRGFASLQKTCWSKNFEFGDFNFEKRLATGLHTFPILRSIAHSSEISKNLSYPAFCYAEEDFIITDIFLEFLKKEFSIISSGLYEFSGFESYTTEGGVNPCVFLANPVFFSRHLNPSMLRGEDDFFLNFPNKITEDVLYDIARKTKNVSIKKSGEILKILGEYGVGWDISHVGFSWAQKIDKNSLSIICTNYPFLRKKDDLTYSLSFLMRQELISETLGFYAKIVLQNEDGSESFVFENDASLWHDWWEVWLDILDFQPNKNSKLIVKTRIKSSTGEVSTDFILRLTPEELDGYHSIFSLRKVR